MFSITVADETDSKTATKRVIMEKNGKILLIILIFIIGLILLDTLQARIFKRSPIIS